MAYTQTDISNIVNGLLRFQGQRIAFPSGHYQGECTAVAVWYLTNMGAPVPPMWNDRADGWGIRFPPVLDPFFIHEPYQAGKVYPMGTLLIWDSPHIAIVTHSDGSDNVQVFEQNADPNGAPCKVTNRVVNNQFHTCIFALIPRTAAPAPPPPPAPTVHPYQIRTVDPYKARTKLPATWLYRLNYDNLPALAANHAETMAQGYEFTVTAELQHNVGKTFLLREGYDGNSPTGFLKDECEPVPAAVPYQPPAAPIQFPHSDDYYTVYDTLIAYKSSNDALNDQNGQNGQGIVRPGTKYYIYNKRKAAGSDRWAYNVTPVRGQAGSWIDESKNRPIQRGPVPVVSNVPATIIANIPIPELTPLPEPEPVIAPVEAPPTTITIAAPSDTPEQIRASYFRFMPDNSPIKCRVKQDVYVTELLHQGTPKKAKAGWSLSLYGTVEKNGRTYAVCRLGNQAAPPAGQDMYAVAVNSRTDLRPNLIELEGFIDHMRLEVEAVHDLFARSRLARTIDGVIKTRVVKK